MKQPSAHCGKLLRIKTSRLPLAAALLAALTLPATLRADTETVDGIEWTYTVSDCKAKKLSANKFKAPKGKKFAGWATSKANAKKGIVKYKNKASVKNLLTNGKTVKLYAAWKKK